MKRDVYKQLLEWKNSKRRIPIILRGARQVGKTYLLEEFAKNEYHNHVYLNFEDDSTLDAFFTRRFEIEKIISHLSAYGEVKVSPGTTLIRKIQTRGTVRDHSFEFKKDGNIANYPLYAISLFPIIEV